MALVRSLEQPLLVSSSLTDEDSIYIKFAERFAKRILRARFCEDVYQTLGIDETANGVAKPLMNLGVLVIAMVFSSFLTLCYLNGMNYTSAPSCVAFEFESYTPETTPLWGIALTIKTRSDWNKHRIDRIIKSIETEQEVRYEYFAMMVNDIWGRGFQIETSPPWDADVSQLEFPIFLSLFWENAISVSDVIKANVFLQLMNPLWLMLSCSSLWGWVHLSVLVPSVHILQLGSAWVVVSCAVSALMSPPPVLPSMNEQQLQNFNRCKGNSQGLWILTWVLMFQTIIACLLLPAAGAVGMYFSHLAKRFSKFSAIKVIEPSKDHSSSICPICLDSLSSIVSNPEDPGPGTLWTLPCSHTFHKDCVLPWLIQGHKSVGTCPTCRAS